MNWVILLFAGLFEVAWATGLKYSHGFTKFWPSVFTVVTTVISFILLAQAMKTLPLGTAYAVWTGIGSIGAAVTGIMLFGDPLTVPRVVCLVMIVAGIAGLKIIS